MLFPFFYETRIPNEWHVYPRWAKKIALSIFLSVRYRVTRAVGSYPVVKNGVPPLPVALNRNYVEITTAGTEV